MPTNDNVKKVVFIDASVPDLQDLLNGLAPGEQAFVIDPNSDGLQQIANILATDNLSDLSSISIVSHGETGELELGSALVTDGNLANHAGALAQIGAALAPSGSIQLFGCDVAQGASGQQFINNFSALAGGAVVDASTHPVGSTALHGSWLLDATSNNAPAPAPDVPFTSQALAAFSGTLPVVAHPDGELFYLINNGPDNELGDINSTVATGSMVYTHPTDSETTVAVDTAAGLVFTPGRGIAGTGTYDAVVVHSAKTGATLETLPFGANNGDVNTDDIVQAVAINPFNDTLYVGDWGVDNNTTGIREFTYNPSTGALTPVATNGGFLFTAAQTESTPGNDATARFTNAGAMYLDPAHNLLYYVNDDNGYDFSPFPAANGVYVVSTTGPTFNPTELTSNGSGTGQFPTSDQSGAGTFVGAHGNIVGLAVDVAHNIVYFETTDVANSANNALWWVNTTSPNQTATKITLPAGVTLNFAGQSNEGTDAAGLSFDPQLRQLYLTNAFETGSDPNNSAIYVLQLDSTGHNVALVNTLNSTALLGQSPGTVNGFETPSATTFDVLPVLTVSGSATPAVERGAAVQIASTATATDADGNHFASATVQITGGTFTSNEASSSDDHLSVNGATSGIVAGTNITVSYNSTSETLSLTGYDTIADYQTVLGEVEYNATGHNPTNFGTDTTRTVTWMVSDGASNIPAGSQNSQTSTITIQAVNDAPVLNNVATSASYTEAGAVATLSSAVSVSDLDNLSLQSATVVVTGGNFANDGDVLAATTTGTGITATYNSANETLTLSGSDTLTHYQQVLDTVTFSSTSQNPTDYGADVTRQVSWTLDDGGGANNLSNTPTTTVNITAVNNAPVLSGVTASVSYTAATPAVTLSPSVTVADVDNLNLASATVAITGGFSGDGDVLAATTAGTGITANYLSASETLTLSGSDTLAHYQQVLDTVTFLTGANGTNGGANPGRTVSWVLNDGSASHNLSAAVQSSISISGAAPAAFDVHVYFDANNDGTQDSGDTNMAGVTVNLLDGSGNPTGTSLTTDSNGNASFTNLAPGTYEVSVITPSGDIVSQATNVLTPNTLTAGDTANAIVGVFAAAPVAHDDSFTTTVGTALPTENVLTNDTDAAGHALTAVLVSSPADAASFHFNADGTFSYTPAAGFVGNDTFTYHDVDQTNASLVSNTATVTITVNDTAPTANPHSYATVFDTAAPPNSHLIGNVLTDSVADADANHPTLTAAQVSAPSHGNLALASDGSFTYTPYLGFAGNDSFTYDSIDGHGTHSASHAAVSIAVNDAANTFDFSTGPNSSGSWVANLSASPEYAFNSAAGLQTLTGINNVVTGSGNNTVVGNNNGDVLISGAGNDSIRGGTGNDIIASGNGTNSMTGAGGNNTFVFTPGSFKDTITDFHVGQDTLDFEGFGGLSISQILADANGAASTVIALAPNEQITLTGVTAAALQAAQAGGGHHPLELNV